MAPTALTFEGNSTQISAAGGEFILKRKKHLAPSGKTTNDPPLKRSDARQNNLMIKELMPFNQGYKELVFSQGRLGLSLRFFEHKIGAEITAIDPACTFGKEIRVGDRIVSIDGREPTKPADLLVGAETLRCFRFASTATATRLDKALVTLFTADRLVGKRKRETGNVTEEAIEAANKCAKNLYQMQSNTFQLAQQGDECERVQFNKWHKDWDKYQKDLDNHYRSRYANGWEQRYQELIRFKHENDGDCNNIPLKYRDPDDLALGEWAELQRELYYEGKLYAERLNCLLEQGFDFEPLPTEKAFTGDEYWDNKLVELLEYKRVHSHCNVSSDYPVEETLSQWVQRQRDSYNDGTIDEDRHAILEKNGFVFEPGTDVKKTVITVAWKRNYKELVQFNRDHGHLEVPIKYKATSASRDLGDWVRLNKNSFRLGTLSKNHIRLLEELGLDLAARKRSALFHEKWNSSYNDLVSYREQHGHCNVPKHGKDADVLASWVRTQRIAFRTGKLTELRVHRLLEIGFEFNPSKKSGENEDNLPPSNQTIFNNQAWIINYENLKQFVERNGHTDVPLDYNVANIEGCLHAWIETQKNFFTDGNLPPRNTQVLEELGVNLRVKSNPVTDRNEEAWNTNFDTLKKFHEEKGHTDVAPGDSLVAVIAAGGNRCFTRWVQTQVLLYKKSKLSEKRTSLLESLGMGLNATKRPAAYKYKSRCLELGPPLGEMPTDEYWFEHDDGIQRRVPNTWVHPQMNFEEMYVLYHCQHHMNEQTKLISLSPMESECVALSPMKLFETSDMIEQRYHHALSRLHLLCGIVDRECKRKGVVIKGHMTEEEARRCVRIGSQGLNIPLNNGTPRDALRMKCYPLFALKNPDGYKKKKESKKRVKAKP